MKKVTITIISGEWFSEYDPETNELISPPEYIDETNSRIISKGDGVIAAKTENELLTEIKNLKLKPKL